MPSSYTTSLRLTLPATGELSGQWGNTVNTGITELLDAAVAGTASISTWGGAGVAYTLSNNSGTADEARKMFIVATGSPGEAKNVICPAVSKFYVFRNDTTGGYALTLKTSGGTGIAVPAGQYKFLYCDGTNVVEMFNSAGALTLSGALTVNGTATFASNPTLSAGTANQVQYLNASKVLTGSANLTFNGTTLTAADIADSSLTATRVTYAGASGNLVDSANLTFNGTTLTSTGFSGPLNGSVGATTPSTGAFTTLSASSTVSGTGFTNLFASPPAIGSTAANTGAFTTLTTSSTVTLNGGTANGVLYLNGSKVATSGSALTFDGTRLGVGGNPASTGFDTGVTQAFIVAPNSNTGAAATFIADSVGRGVLVADQAKTTIASIAVGGSVVVVGSNSNTPVAFNVNATEQMRLTSTGLGIGTSSPGEKLNVIGGGSTTSTVNFTGANGVDNATIASDYSLVFQVDANNNVGGREFNWRYGGKGYSDGTLLMVLNSSGNLGLGVTPSAWGTTAQTAIQLAATGALSSRAAGNTDSAVTHGAYYDGTNWRYIASSTGAARYQMTGANAGSTHSWSVSAGGTAGNTISFTQAMTLTAAGVQLLGTTTSPSGSAPALVVQTAVGGGVQYAHGSGGGGLIYAQSGGGLLFNSYTGAVGSESYTERARITSGGYFKASNTGAYYGSTDTWHELINSSGGSHTAVVHNTAATLTGTGARGLFINYTAAPNAADRGFISCFDGNATTERATIRSNGGLANYSGNNVNLSDRREKTNFAPAKSYLDTICAIPVQTFNYIDQSEDDPGLTLGVVAQDVQAVAPEFVMESNWGTEDNPKMRLSIYQTDLQYALMKCVQELKAQNDELRARVAALEAQP